MKRHPLVGLLLTMIVIVVGLGFIPSNAGAAGVVYTPG